MRVSIFPSISAGCFCSSKELVDHETPKSAGGEGGSSASHQLALSIAASDNAKSRNTNDHRGSIVMQDNAGNSISLQSALALNYLAHTGRACLIPLDEWQKVMELFDAPIEEPAEIFDALDVDGEGTISMDELSYLTQDIRKRHQENQDMKRHKEDFASTVNFVEQAKILEQEKSYDTAIKRKKMLKFAVEEAGNEFHVWCRRRFGSMMKAWHQMMDE